MAKKKLKAKNSQVKQAVPHRRKKILGLDVRDLGAAIAAAVVSEIAQVAIQKAGQNSASDDFDRSGNAARKSSQGAIESVKESFMQNPVQHGASVLASAVNQVNPSLGKLANAVKDTSQATRQSINDTVSDTASVAQYTAEDTAENVTGSVGSTINVMDDTVKDVIQEATEKVVSLFNEDNSTGKKSKKGKNKSGQKKQKKKGKK